MQWHDHGDDQRTAGDQDPIETGDELAFTAADERLPWLEADDDYQDTSTDTGRIVAFALIGLLAVIAIVGGLWWLSRASPDPALVADGSLIEAPEEPYKERPENPGGRDVEGTGNSSFEVAEGRRTDARVADATPAPRPTATASEAAKNDSANTAAAPVSGVGVQIGAYSSRSTAEAGWNQMSGRFEVLKGVSHRILEASADGGTIYRLQAVPGDRAAADALCRNLKAAGGDCQVKR